MHELWQMHCWGGERRASKHIGMLPYSITKGISFCHKNLHMSTSYTGTSYAAWIRFLHEVFQELWFLHCLREEVRHRLGGVFWALLLRKHNISQTFLHRWKRIFEYFFWVVISCLNVRYWQRNWVVCCVFCILGIFGCDARQIHVSKLLWNWL